MVRRHQGLGAAQLLDLTITLTVKFDTAQHRCSPFNNGLCSSTGFQKLGQELCSSTGFQKRDKALFQHRLSEAGTRTLFQGSLSEAGARAPPAQIHPAHLLHMLLLLPVLRGCASCHSSHKAGGKQPMEHSEVGGQRRSHTSYLVLMALRAGAVVAKQTFSVFFNQSKWQSAESGVEH